MTMKKEAFLSVAMVGFGSLSTWGGVELAFSGQEASTVFRVRVVDAVTGLPVQGMPVEVRSKQLAADGFLVSSVSDASGAADLTHPEGFNAVESVIALGSDDYHYVAFAGSPASDEVVLYSMPYSAFWKSPVIAAASGTAVAPLTLSGTFDGFDGPLPYAISIHVPPHVLPADSQIWVAARPIYQPVNCELPADHAPAHFGQLHIQLRTADGKSVMSTPLKAPGVQITASPWWLPASTYPISDNVVVRRLNTSTLTWDVLSPKGAFNAATGLATFSLRSFSCIDISSERYGNALVGNPNQQTNPPTSAPPPQNLPTVEWEDCYRLWTPATSIPVVCCTYQASGSNAISKGTKITSSEKTVDEIMTNFNIGAGEMGKVFAKVSWGRSSKTVTSQENTIESEVLSDQQASVTIGAQLANCSCLTGTCDIIGLAKRATLKKAGCEDVIIEVFAKIGLVYCLQYQECGPGCNAAGPHSARVVSVPGQKICAGEWPECQ